MYVGMCFATFCWHNEDHWSYSINYLHWGEPKTWYGVPGSKAECFEESMKSAAPELFHSQPDLLHQLVTIMNPNILMGAGVPVYRTDQHAGEFVITFPRAYHAGFNQGYNFAEAVNFAPADWLKMGRECIAHYSHLRRFCVFSHDELVCKMALDPDKLDLTVAAATYQDMLLMVDNEKKMRKSLLEWGVTEAEREAFELLPDDERQCEVCKTTCFLSAMTCSCRPKNLVCLRHYTSLCSCTPDKHTLRYRYTLDELPLMLQKLKRKAESFDNWVNLVKEALDPNTPKTMDLDQFKKLLHEAEIKKFPKSELLQTLTLAVEDADKCSSVIHQLDLNKIRTRTRFSVDTKYKLTVEELTLFCEEIDSLACTLKEAKTVKDLLKQTQDFQKKASNLLNQDINGMSVPELNRCIDSVSGLCIELPELKQLKLRLKQLIWLKDTRVTRGKKEYLTVDMLRSMVRGGLMMRPHPVIEREVRELQLMLNHVEKWEERAKELVELRPYMALKDLEVHVALADDINGYLPTEETLRDLLKRAKEWVKQADEVHSGENYPYFNTIAELIRKGRQINVSLPDIDKLEGQYTLAKSWKERTARIFLRRNTCDQLMECLSPRYFPSVKSCKKTGKTEQTPTEIINVKMQANLDPAQIVSAFKEAEEQELDGIRSLRDSNSGKINWALEERCEPNEVLCICKRGISGAMIQCELCKDWFHTSCVTLPKHLYHPKAKLNLVSIIQFLAAKDPKFLCPHCLRTRRPRLETILSLLVSLQKLQMRLPEGEALQCLTERAMNWQDRARQLLATEELAAAMTKLTVLSQKYIDAIAREKTEKIISSELKRAASNPELLDRVQQISALSGVQPESENGKKTPVKEKDDCISEEHTYSATPAALTTMDEEDTLTPPILELKDSTKAQLIDLMMEGDLLEVSLDETVHLWKLLHSTKTMADSDRTYIDSEVSI